MQQAPLQPHGKFSEELKELTCDLGSHNSAVRLRLGLRLGLGLNMSLQNLVADLLPNGVHPTGSIEHFCY